jgi:hypothetical protein
MHHQLREHWWTGRSARVHSGAKQRKAANLTCKPSSAADRDIVTWILKTYGDALEGDCQAGSPEEGSQCKVLRSVMLLICLTEQHIVRFLPQVYDECCICLKLIGIT